MCIRDSGNTGITIRSKPGGLFLFSALGTTFSVSIFSMMPVSSFSFCNKGGDFVSGFLMTVSFLIGFFDGLTSLDTSLRDTTLAISNSSLSLCSVGR